MLPYDADLALRIYRYQFRPAEGARSAATAERRGATGALLRSLKSRLLAALIISPVGEIRRRPA